MCKNFFNAIKNNFLEREKNDYILKIYKIFRSIYYFLMIHLTKSDNKTVFKYLSSQNDDFQKTIKTRFFKKPFFIPKSKRVAYLLIETEGEDQEIKLIHEKLSNPTTYIDVGANIGYWAFSRIILLNNNIKYFCFEPSKINFYYLKKNFENVENVEIVKCALSNQCGTGTLSFPKWEKSKESEMNSGLLSLYGNTDIYCENVEIKTLDTCFLKKDLSSNIYLKIDVEGNEYKVLKGGENFLSQNLDITVQIELNFKIDNIIKNNNIQNSINFLRDLKYTPFSFSNNQIKFLSEDELNIIVTNKQPCELYFRKKQS